MLVEVLSVHLFNVVVNLATSKFNDRFGFTVNDLKLKFLAFADDLLLFADSQVGLQWGSWTSSSRISGWPNSTSMLKNVFRWPSAIRKNGFASLVSFLCQ